MLTKNIILANIEDFSNYEWIKCLACITHNFWCTVYNYYYRYHQGTYDRDGNHYIININYWPFMMWDKSLPIEFNGTGSLRFGDIFKSLGRVIIYMGKVPGYPLKFVYLLECPWKFQIYQTTPISKKIHFMRFRRFSCDCILLTKFSVKSWNLV